MHAFLRLPPHTATRKSSPRELLVSAGLILLLGSAPTLLRAVVYSVVVFGGITWPHTAQLLSEAVNITTTTLQLVWLASLVRARTQAYTHSRGVSLALSVCGLGALTVWGLLRHPNGPYMHEYPVRACLLAWLCYEVYRRHGIALSAPATASTRAARWDSKWQITWEIVGCCCIGGVSTFAALVALQQFGPSWLPVMRTSQLTALGGASVPEMAIFALVWTVVLEGSVIGATAILLSAARRPPWQIYGTIATVEIIFHAYYGAPAVFTGVYAVLCTYFYLRYHQIVPLLAGHAVFDFIGLLSNGHSLTEGLPYFIAKLPYLIASTLVVGLIDRWLAVKSGREAKFIEWPRLRRLAVKFRTARPSADACAADRSETTSRIS